MTAVHPIPTSLTTTTTTTTTAPLPPKRERNPSSSSAPIHDPLLSDFPPPYPSSTSAPHHPPSTSSFQTALPSFQFPPQSSSAPSSSRSLQHSTSQHLHHHLPPPSTFQSLPHSTSDRVSQNLPPAPHSNSKLNSQSQSVGVNLPPALPHLPHQSHPSQNLHLSCSPSAPNHSSHMQSLQPLLQHQNHPLLLPALNHPHFKQPDEVDVQDDLINLSSLPTSSAANVRHEMQAALVNSTFPHEHIHNSAQIHHSVIDSILPDAEQDPLNMTVNMLPIESQRTMDSHLLAATSEPDHSHRPSISSALHHQHHPMLSPNVQLHTTAPLNTTRDPPFSLHMPPSMAHLSYGTSNNPVPHPHVLIHATSSVSPFSMGRTAPDHPTGLMLARAASVRHQQQQGLLQLGHADEINRRAGLASNQISIQDLTKPKIEHMETCQQDAQQQQHYSPASPSFSAVTISPSALVHTSQPPPVVGLTSAGLNTNTITGGDSPTSIVAAPQGLCCPICKSVFTRRYNLKVHMSSKHSARRDYTCPQCPNAFNRVDSLKRHIATTHRGEKKWTCNYCNRNFGQRPHMKMHIDTVHLKKRDHKCHCGKAFGTRYNLTAHQRTHEQTPKKHVCTVCKKSFALKSSLARHQRNSAHTNVTEMPAVPNVSDLPN